MGQVNLCTKCSSYKQKIIFTLANSSLHSVMSRVYWIYLAWADICLIQPTMYISSKRISGVGNSRGILSHVCTVDRIVHSFPGCGTQSTAVELEDFYQTSCKK